MFVVHWNLKNFYININIYYSESRLIRIFPIYFIRISHKCCRFYELIVHLYRVNFIKDNHLSGSFLIIVETEAQSKNFKIIGSYRLEITKIFEKK